MNRATVRNGAVFLSAVLLAVVLAGGLSGRRDSAQAADSETAALIGYFNQYRASYGAPALSVSSSANADAQAAASYDAQACGYQLPPESHSLEWIAIAYDTASSLWQSWQPNGANPYPQILEKIRDPKYRSAGVGRAYSRPGCNYGWVWVMILDKTGGNGTPPPTPPPTASKTPTPSPSKTPTPSPSKTPTPSPGLPTPTPTGTPSVTPTLSPTVAPSGSYTPAPTDTVLPSVTPLPTDTGIASETPTPSPTPVVPLFGDGDCDGMISLDDGMLVLQLVAGNDVGAECLPLDGFDCLGGVDLLDVLAILEYLSGIPGATTTGCPRIGDPLPTPVPSETPTPTPTGEPSPAVSPTPTAAPNLDHCVLAMVSYQVVNAQALAGPYSCTVEVGVSYSCNFGVEENKASCQPGSSGMPSYSCFFTNDEYAACIAISNPQDYECFNSEGTVTCFGANESYASYSCAVIGDAVSCEPLSPGYPDFVCVKDGTDFPCAIVPAE